MLSRGLGFHAVVCGGDIMWAVLFVADSQIEVAGKVLRGGRYRGIEGGGYRGLEVPRGGRICRGLAGAWWWRRALGCSFRRSGELKFYKRCGLDAIASEMG